MSCTHSDQFNWRTIDGLTIDVTLIRHRQSKSPQSKKSGAGATGRLKSRNAAMTIAAEGGWELVTDTGDNARATPNGAQSVDSVIRQHDRMLVRWLAQKFGDIETARDIAQSAYLRVWRYAQSQPIDNMQALLFKTAANLAANEFRARKRMRRLTVASPGQGEEDAVDRVASQTPSPEATALAREQVAAASAAINALPDQTRRAFVLSRFEDKTYREIAALLGVSESSVEKYIIAALKALRKAAIETEGGNKVVQLHKKQKRF